MNVGKNMKVEWFIMFQDSTVTFFFLAFYIILCFCVCCLHYITCTNIQWGILTQHAIVCVGMKSSIRPAVRKCVKSQ